MSLDHLKKGNESSEPTINFQKTCWFSWICDSSMLGKTEPKVFFQMVVFHDDLHHGRIRKKSPLKKSKNTTLGFCSCLRPCSSFCMFLQHHSITRLLLLAYIFGKHLEIQKHHLVKGSTKIRITENISNC